MGRAEHVGRAEFAGRAEHVGRAERVGHAERTEAGRRILVVEDDASISDVVCSTLRGEGYSCAAAYSGTEARLLIEGGEAFDLAICDLMLPGMPGEDVVALIRAHGDAPILVISAKAQVIDRVTLLRMGADDYLVKPFDLDELVARVEALLRRAGCGSGRASAARGDAAASAAGCGSAAFAARAGAPGDDEGFGLAAGADARDGLPGEPDAELESGFAPLVFGAWRLVEGERRFEAAGEPVRLTRTEFDIVSALMRHPRKVFTKRELYRAVWHEDAAVEEKAINTHVSNIRAKLRPSGTDRYIETVWGIGFKLADNPTNRED